MWRLWANTLVYRKAFLTLPSHSVYVVCESKNNNLTHDDDDRWRKKKEFEKRNETETKTLIQWAFNSILFPAPANMKKTTILIHTHTPTREFASVRIQIHWATRTSNKTLTGTLFSQSACCFFFSLCYVWQCVCAFSRSIACFTTR